MTSPAIAGLIFDLDDLLDGEYMATLRCYGCGHRADEHQTVIVARGPYPGWPDEQTWCDGGGQQEVTDSAGDVIEVVELCGCGEFE